MSDRGDDCYFFFYSTCTRGASCRFRHCEAALGSETVCALWREGRCFRRWCRDRHMVMDKKRSEIPCFWESQPTGCQKRNCAFHHKRGRYLQGLYLPPSKTLVPTVLGNPQAAKAELAPQGDGLAAQPGPCAALQSVSRMQGESDPGVPGPGHPPEVISVGGGNEDDPDLSSKEGDQTNTLPPGCAPEVPGGLQKNSTQKPGVETLQQAVPSAVSNPVLQPQLLPTVVRTVTMSSKAEPLVRLSLSERLGKGKLSASGECDPSLKRSLRERLGKEVGAPETDLDRAAKKAQISKSLQEQITGASPGPRRREAATRGDKAGDIPVKTLEEILAGRAHRKHAELHTKLKTRSPSAAEGWTSRASGFPSTQMKTLSEGFAENEYRQQQKARHQCKGDAAGIKRNTDTGIGKTLLLRTIPVSKGHSVEPVGTRKSLQEVHVKTLEEIKWEKALRMQQSAEWGTRSQPRAQASQGTGRLLQLPKCPGAKEEKKPHEGAEIVSQSTVTRATTGETSAEAPGAGSALVLQRSETLAVEKHTQEEQERGCTREGKSALPPLREDVASGGTRLEKAVLTAEAGLPPCLTKQLPTGSCQEVEGETSDPGHSKPKRKRAPQSLAPKGKADSRGNGKPSGVKVLSSPPLAPKRKASEMHGEGEGVAAGEPLSSASALQGPPAKKAALAAVAPFLEHRPVAAPEMEKPRDSLELSPSQSSPHLPSLRGFGPYSFQMATDSCKASSASTGEAWLCKEDDFEELLLENSGDKSEDAIDLDLEKDENELLIELLELIDS